MTDRSLSRLEYIDFSKGFAIFCIVCMHLWQDSSGGVLKKLLMLGGTGVHLFFLLSGFALSLSDSKSTLDFYRSRLTKIIEPYFFVVTVSYLVQAFIFPYFGSDGLDEYLSHIFLYKMFDGSKIESFGYQLWFLSAILCLYLIYPALINFKSKFGDGWLLFFALLVSMAYWAFVVVVGGSGNRAINSFFLQFLWEFCLGIYLAGLYNRNSFEFWGLPGLMLFAAMLVGFFVMALLVYLFGNVGRQINDLPALIGFLALSIILWRFCKRCGGLVYIGMLEVGRLSYSLYLTHVFVFLVIGHGLRGQNLLVVSGVSLLGALFVAYFFDRLWERRRKISRGKFSV